MTGERAPDPSALLRRALVRIEELDARLEAAERRAREPIAILGMSCRFPGAADPEAYWRLLADGRDAVTEIPKERWDVDAYYDADPDARGRVHTRWGCFVDGIDRFDAGLFGISPREAALMDPQQRLLLEVAWEALERAGIAPPSLLRSRTGVVIGISSHDYFELATGSPEMIDAYTGSGTAGSVAAGRLAYVLGLEGPAFCVDSACSSSLVAVHLACRQLRAGECDRSLVGGVSLMLTPTLPMIESRTRMLSPDGRCKPFDAAANGVVRGEGCGVLVLRRLADAEAAGDPILAVIRGTAVNQDGRSAGITVPNGLAQEAVIRDALGDAGLAPAQIGYVEAHGTGTALGDPIEAEALAHAIAGARAPGAPLLLGSVKSNIGHLEAAAGIAGLMKTVLALVHRELPPTLHLARPNPRIAWDGLEVVTRARPWPAIDGRRIAGTSSFGFSGTNAHVVVEAAPERPAIARPDRPDGARSCELLPLSAATPGALAELAARYARFVDAHPEVPLGELCAAAQAGRAHLAHRRAVVAGGREELAARLAERAAPAPAPGGPPRVAFLFSGQGTQHGGMGCELHAAEPVFRDALERAGALLAPHLDRPLRALLEDGAALASTRFTQPALFALEYALAQLWRSWGVEPAAMLGHSLGELTAACVAGVMPLDAALALVVERARRMDELTEPGRMVAVFSDEATVAAAIGGRRVAIAAVNGPRNVVVSGAAADVDAVVAALQQRGLETRALAVSRAFHSPLMEPMLPGFAEVAGRLALAPPALRLISNLSGRPLEGAPSARHFVDHVRQPVRFADGVASLRAAGCDVFLELGPGSTLLELARGCLPEGGADGAGGEGGAPRLFLPSLGRGVGEVRCMLESLAALYERGVAVRWPAPPGPRRPPVRVPTYPFERRRHWLEDARPSFSRAASAPPEPRLLGRRLDSPAWGPGELHFEATWSQVSPAFLGQHRVFGRAIVPATVFLEMALEAGRAAFGASRLTLTDVVFERALVLPAEGAVTVQLVSAVEADGARGFRIFSRDDAASGPAIWRLHAAGRIALAPAATPEPVDGAALRAGCAAELDVAAHYARTEAFQLELGPAFRAIQRLWRHPRGGLALVGDPAALTRALDAATGLPHYLCSPPQLDACLHALSVELDEAAGDAQLPVRLARLTLHGLPGPVMSCHTRRRSAAGAQPWVVDATIFSEADGGRVAITVEGLELRATPREAALAIAGDAGAWLYDVAWRDQPRAGLAAASFPAPAELARACAAALEAVVPDDDARAYAAGLAELEALSAGYVVAALERLGWRLRAGEHFTADALAALLGISARHRRLFGRLLAILAEDGLVERRDDEWHVVREPGAPATSAARVRAAHPGRRAELAMLERCGEALDAVLRGARDPLELLFPGADVSEVATLYQNTPVIGLMNTAARLAVLRALEQVPEGHAVRILEVGAGTGETTSHLLPHLAPERTAYRFTDVSPLFVRRGEERFAAHRFVRYEVLDVEQPAAEAGDFDLVIASNVVHATRDARATLRNLRQRLAPGGLLILLEGTARLRWVDLTFGLTEGWWRFADRELRPDYPLLPAAGWRRALEQEGFEATAVVTGEQAGVLGQQAVVVAQRGLAPRAAPGTWLILADRGGVGRALAELVEARGGACVLVHAGGDPALELAGLLPRLPADLRRVVHLWSLDAPPASELTVEALRAFGEASIGGCLALVQALAASRAAAPPALALVTRGAQPGGEPLDGLAAAPLLGLGKVIAREHPELRCRTIDLDPRAPAAPRSLLEELELETAEAQVMLRGGRRRVARLVRATLPPASPPLRLPGDASYLITGGCGGLGLVSARWLVARGARHLALLGRTAPAAGAVRIIEELRRGGAELRVLEADVSDAAAMARALAELDATMPPLRGVLHAAGVVDDGVLARQSWARFARVFAAKVDGALVLHRLTRDRALDFCVYYASAVSLLGAWGQANHTAANGFLDALAHHRRALGLVASSVDWGAWQGVGAADVEGADDRMRAVGMGTIDLARGLDVLERVIVGAPVQLGVFPIDWSEFAAKLGAGPFFAEVLDAGRDAGDASAGLVRQLDAAAPADRAELLGAYLRDAVARTLRLAPESIGEDRRLFELGVDSLMAVELRNQLSRALGKPLRSTLIFDFPTIAALTRHLGDEVLGVLPAAAPPPPSSPGASGASGASGAAREVEEMSAEALEALIDGELETLTATKGNA